MNSCNICGERNRPGVLICEHCGLPIENENTRKVADLESGATLVLETGNLGTDFIITLYIPSADQYIQVRNAPEVLLGRFEQQLPHEPYVDFSPLGGLEKGVSRLHASLKRWDGRVLLVDRGSSNGTFVNNQHIERGKEVRLFDGDEIRLGLLVTRIQIG